MLPMDSCRLLGTPRTLRISENGLQEISNNLRNAQCFLGTLGDSQGLWGTPRSCRVSRGLIRGTGALGDLFRTPRGMSPND